MAKKKVEIDVLEQELHAILKKTRIPILTLDERWHNLCPDSEKTQKIRELEKKLNDLVKSQGQLNNDITDLRNLKKRLMEQVLVIMDEPEDSPNKIKLKKQEKLKKLILDCNEKIKASDMALEDRPDQIRQANTDLFLECVRVWYGKLSHNKQQIKEITGWIDHIKERLAEQTVIKQSMEAEVGLIYSYMHTLLGPAVMEQVDGVYEERGLL